MDTHCRKTAAATLGIAAAAVGAVFTGVLYSGVVDIAASKPHFALTKEVLEVGMERSVERHAAGIVPPPSYADDQVRHGFDHYRAMCEICHAAPGVERSDIAKGLRPRPPDLVKAMAELKDAEAFWIVRHGIKFTGMPGFGETHSEGEIWAIVGFLRRLRVMSADEYRRWKETAKPGETHRH